MAVGFDASSENVAAADPQGFTHTPSGTPRAAIVLIAHGTTATDIVSGVTYGGVTMSRVTSFATPAAGEQGRAYIYFLGASVPTGAQSVSVDRTEATTIVSCVGVTLTAAADCEVVDFDGLAATVQADPSVTLQYSGRTCIALGSLYGGGSSPAAATMLSGMTAMQSEDFGNFFARMDRQTTPGTSDFTIGYTMIADDAAFAAAAISEVSAGGFQAAWARNANTIIGAGGVL